MKLGLDVQLGVSTSSAKPWMTGHNRGMVGRIRVTGDGKVGENTYCTDIVMCQQFANICDSLLVDRDNQFLLAIGSLSM